MSQHDYVIDNATGVGVRGDINNALAALVSNNSGATEPATPYAYMFWVDTSVGQLKVRNGSNTGWIALGDITLANLGHLTSYFPAGTKLIFYQASPPTGWTKDTANNDKALRVVSGGGGGTGGTHNLSSPPSTAHTHDLGSHYHAAPASGPHALTVNEIPLHSHSFSVYNSGPPDSAVAYKANSSSSSVTASTWNNTSTDSGQTHPSGGNTGVPSNNTSGSGSPTAFAPKYIDVIVAIKD